MNININIESLADNQFKIVIEDEVAVTTETTTSPQRVIQKALQDLGIKGKRGRKKGYTIAKAHSVDSSIIDVIPS